MLQTEIFMITETNERSHSAVMTAKYTYRNHGINEISFISYRNTSEGLCSIKSLIYLSLEVNQNLIQR